jgi:peptidyl-prolyl cis-trans isomerase C
MSVKPLFHVAPMFLVLFSLYFLPSLARAETDEVDPNEVLAVQGDAVLTQAEIDAEFSKISPEYRLNYIRSGERVNNMVAALLRAKLVAGKARAAKYDEDPLVRGLLSLSADETLAEAWIKKIIEDAPAADYELLGEEEYLVYSDEFKSEEMVDVSHILINNEKRSNEEALELAQSLRAQLAEDPARFDEFVMEYSEDPSKFSNEGRFQQVVRGEMVKPFEDMSFSMETSGDISQPVQTAYGYHIIRLNEKFPPIVKPYEEVKEEAMARAKERHLDAYRSQYIKSLIADPIVIPEGAVEIMLKRYFGENLELAPVYDEPTD